MKTAGAARQCRWYVALHAATLCCSEHEKEAGAGGNMDVRCLSAVDTPRQKSRRPKVYILSKLEDAEDAMLGQHQHERDRCH